MHTYTTAASKYDDECLEPAGSTDDPDKTNEQYHAEDVLDTREVDAEHCAEFLTNDIQNSKVHMTFSNTDL